MTRAILAAAALSLAGCAIAPYAVVDGAQTGSADPLVHDVIIVAVDGRGLLGRPREHTLAPGFHMLELASSKRDRGALQSQPLSLNARPCTRYHYAARHTGPFDGEWEIVKVREQPIPSCPADAQ